MDLFLDAQGSLAPIHVSWVGHTFLFPFCQRPWALTKRQDDIVVADININMEIEFYEIFRPEAIPACASSNFASSLDAQASLALTPVRPY